MAEFGGDKVFIEVTPSFRGALASIIAESRKWGTDGGKAYKEAFEAQIRGLGGSGAGGGPGPGAGAARQQGNTSGGAYADAFRRRVEAATKALPPIRIAAATSEAESALRDLRSDLEELSGKTVGVDIDAAAASAELERIQAQLTDLAANSPDVRVRVDAAASVAQIAALQAEIKRLDGQDIDIDVDTSSAANAIRRLNQTLDGASINTYSGRLLLLGSAGAALAPAIVPAAAAAAVAIVGIGAAISTALAGVGVLALGLSGIGEAVGAMGKAQTEASKNAQKAAQQQSGASSSAVNSARQIESAEASLANTRATNATAAAKAARSVADAQAGVAESVASGAKRVQEAQNAAAKAAEDGAERVAAAQAAAVKAAEDGAQRIADAEEALARTVTENSRRLEDARRSVADATARAADSIQSALSRYANSERSLADAQETAQRAQESLNDARKQAVTDAQDLALDVESAALRQRDAALSVEEAQKRLNEVRADPKATNLERRQAQLSYEQSVLSLKEIGIRYQRLQAEKAASDKAGIEGSEGVVDAQDRVKDAAERQQDAQAAVASAAEDVAKARVDAAQSIADAQERLTRVSDDAAQSQSDAARRVADATAEAGAARASAEDNVAKAVGQSIDEQNEAGDRLIEATVRAAQDRTEAEQGVTDALSAQAEQQRSAAFSVEQAQRSLEGAYVSAGAGGAAAFVGATAGADALAEAMGKLSPAGQSFAEFLYGILPQLSQLKAAAEAGLLPGLQTAIETLLPSIPALSGFIGELGGVLGNLAISAADALTGPAFSAFFDYMSREGGEILTKTAEGFGGIIVGIANLMVAFEPLTDIFITGFANMGQSFADWAAGLAENETFQGFVDYFKENLPVLQEFFGHLGDAIVTIIESMAPMGPVVLTIVGAILEFIAALPPGVLEAIVLTIVGIVTAFTVLGPVIGFVSSVVAGLSAGLPIIGAVLAALGGPVTLVIVAVIALGAALVALWQNSETVREVFYKVVGFFTDTVAPLLGAVFDYVIGYIAEKVPQAFRDGVAFVKEIWSTISGILDAVWQFTVTNILTPILTYVTVTIPGWFTSAVAFVQTAWAVLETVISAVWTSVVTNVWAPIATFIKVTIPGWFDTAVAAVKIAWALVETTISTVWTSVTTNVFDPIKTFITVTLPGYFTTAVSAIKTAWDLVKDAAKEPVRFIVDTVFNNGLRPAFNKLAAIVPGIDPIEAFALPEGFARGGILPGSSSWHDGDDQLRPMRRGEGVAVSEAMVVPEARQQLLTWNRIAMQGGPAAVQAYMRSGGQPGFATGGIVGRATDAISSAVSNVKDLLSDPAAAFRKILDDLLGDAPGADKGFGKIIAAIPGQLVDGLAGLFGGSKGDDGATGATPTPPPGSGSGSAWQAQVVKAMFPSAQITSGFRPGSITASGNLSYHARGRAVDIAPPNMGIFNGLAAAFPNTAELIYSPAGARQLKNGKSHVYTGAVKQMHYNHVHWAYDQGGYLPPGVTQVYNGTGKPEPVFTADQFEDIRALATGRATAGGGVHLTSYNTISRDVDAEVLARRQAFQLASISG